MTNKEKLEAFARKQWEVQGNPAKVFWPQVTAKRKELKVSQKELFEIIENII